MRVILSGGGTGGHIYPAIAIAEKLISEDASTELLYVGAKLGMEKQLVTDKGLPFEMVDVAPLNRKLSLKTLSGLFQTIKGIYQSYKLIKHFKPDVMIGTGGYVTGPVMLAGALMGVPCAIHEQNAFPGMANKLLSRVVDLVMVTFEEAIPLFPSTEKVVYTGLPVREAFFKADRQALRHKMGLRNDDVLLVSVGGSNGALKLNETMLEAYGKLIDIPSLKSIHITGNRYYDTINESIIQGRYTVSSRFELVAFAGNMPELLSAADLVISRAGASTITEIIATKVPSIVIPSPNVANDHQFYNAMVLDKHGMGLVIKEADLTGDLMASTIRDLIDHKEKLNIMRMNCEKTDVSKALDLINQQILSLTKHKNRSKG